MESFELEEMIFDVLRELHALRERTIFFMANWVSTEVADANLSIIDVGIVNDITGTSQIRFVPKAKSVTGLVAGSTVLCSKNPLLILCEVAGDVKVAIIEEEE